MDDNVVIGEGGGQGNQMQGSVVSCLDIPKISMRKNCRLKHPNFKRVYQIKERLGFELLRDLHGLGDQIHHRQKYWPYRSQVYRAIALLFFPISSLGKVDFVPRSILLFCLNKFLGVWKEREGRPEGKKGGERERERETWGS